MSCYFFTYYFFEGKLLLSSSPLPSSGLILLCFFLEKACFYVAQPDLYLLGTSIHPHLPKLGLQVSVDHCAHLSPHFKSLPLVLFVEEEGEGGPEGGGGTHVHNSHSRSC